MNELLQIGQSVSTRTGQSCKVEKFLGGGGQGEVYKVQWGGTECALKWYYPQSATTEQLAALDALVKKGAPSDRFLWPEDLAEAPQVPGYGYLMRLRPANFKNLNDLVSGRIDPSFVTLLTMGIELTKAFRSLHNAGLCYRDISFGNAFFDPTNGEVLVCDNDNVATNRTTQSGVLGTPDFMAPEVVRMEAMPSRETDFHSLAVLLFYIFHINHPLSGKRIMSIRCWDGAARKDLYGTKPVFIFDPADRSNEAIDKAHDPTGEAGGNALMYWKIWPSVLHTTFTKAFTVGLRDPASRVTELEWLDTLVTVRNSFFRCACGKANFYDVEAVKASQGRPGACWSCGKEPKLPFRIRIGRSVIMLNSDTKLYRHHLGSDDFDLSNAAAEVVRHPTNPNVWGLRNLTSEKWVATTTDGLKDVDPGKSAPLVSGVKISFGKVEGEIRY